MFVESYHRLKTFYLNRGKNRRVDDLLESILGVEEDDYWRHALTNSSTRPLSQMKLTMKMQLIGKGRWEMTWEGTEVVDEGTQDIRYFKLKGKHLANCDHKHFFN